MYTFVTKSLFVETCLFDKSKFNVYAIKITSIFIFSQYPCQLSTLSELFLLLPFIFSRVILWLKPY